MLCILLAAAQDWPSCRRCPLCGGRNRFFAWLSRHLGLPRRDLSYWLSDGSIPLSLDAPPSLGALLLTYEDNLRQHVALVRRMLPATGFLALHTTVRCALQPGLPHDPCPALEPSHQKHVSKCLPLLGAVSLLFMRLPA